MRLTRTLTKANLQKVSTKTVQFHKTQKLIRLTGINYFPEMLSIYRTYWTLFGPPTSFILIQLSPTIGEIKGSNSTTFLALIILEIYKYTKSVEWDL